MTSFFSKKVYYRVIFIAIIRWLIFKTDLLLNPSNFQGFRVLGNLKIFQNKSKVFRSETTYLNNTKKKKKPIV